MPEGVITLIIVLAILAYLYMSKMKKYDTMLRIAELGENVDEKVFAILEKERRTYKDDYRYSLIWFAIGVPVAYALWGLSEGSERVLGFPALLLGIAYFVSARLRLRDSDS